MNSYFLCVTQPFNVGDLLINKMLVEELSHYGKVYVDCYNCPEDFRAVLIGNSENVIDIYNKYNFTLKKGALFSFARFLKNKEITLYTQSPGPLNKIKNLPMRISFALIRQLLFLLGVPFVRIGNCCSAAIASNINVLESKHVQYYVRSQKAVEYLRKLRSDHVFYIPDLAYLYKYQVNNHEKNKIAILSFRNIFSRKEEFVKWVRNCVLLLFENGYKVIFYHQVKSDFTSMQELYKLIGCEDIEMRNGIVWYDSFDFYADKAIVISNRLHCLLVGAVFNAVPLAYIDNENSTKKIQDVFESSMGSDSSNYMTDYRSLDKLNEIINNLSQHQDRIKNIVNHNAKLCKDTIRSIVDHKFSINN